ncbi:hypothetical protein [Methylocaldum gracile]|uniref:hypothetical protein n=1 Tax=Methylocaldum sp. 0917 TaxID=2485163 RepID=UPI00105E567B
MGHAKKKPYLLDGELANLSQKNVKLREYTYLLTVTNAAKVESPIGSTSLGRYDMFHKVTGSLVVPYVFVKHIGYARQPLIESCFYCLCLWRSLGFRVDSGGIYKMEPAETGQPLSIDLLLFCILDFVECPALVADLGFPV